MSPLGCRTDHSGDGAGAAVVVVVLRPGEASGWPGSGRTGVLGDGAGVCVCDEGEVVERPSPLTGSSVVPAAQEIRVRWARLREGSMSHW